MSDKPLIFLKLGGSLITHKSQPHTARPEVLSRLAQEIVSAWQAKPDMRLLLGHGSGSFGHIPAQRYATRQGVKTREQWIGFFEVWKEASDLNRLVLDSLHSVGLPAIALPASASVTAQAGEVADWNLFPIKTALKSGLLPVIFGDVVFDREWGGTILSTERLFAHLARHCVPKRLLLAGLEEGVWADFPSRSRLISEITPENIGSLRESLGDSLAVDVTGGMHSKVMEMLYLVQQVPGLEVIIFSGETPGALERILLGDYAGTVIRNPVG